MAMGRYEEGDETFAGERRIMRQPHVAHTMVETDFIRP